MAEPLGGVAPLLNRLVARVLDTMLVLAAVFVLSLAVGALVDVGGEATPASFAAVSIGVALYEGSVLHRWGRTPAKVLLGLAVVRAADGGRPTWIVAVVRSLVVWVLSMVGSYVGGSAGPLLVLGALVALLGPVVVRPDRRGLHDLAAGTSVVRTSEPPSPRTAG